jgi:hypothetical protein
MRPLMELPLVGFASRNALRNPHATMPLEMPVGGGAGGEVYAGAADTALAWEYPGTAQRKPPARIVVHRTPRAGSSFVCNHHGPAFAPREARSRCRYAACIENRD